MRRFKNKRNEEWLEWLADEQAPASVRQRLRQRSVKEASRPVRVHNATKSDAVVSDKPAPSANKTVSINISVPRFTPSRPKLVIPTGIVAHKWWILGGTFCLVAVIGVGYVLSKPDSNPSSETAAVLSQSDTKASFDYSLPDGNESEVDGQVRFDPEKQVVNFVDSIGGIDITISQQPLPEDFKDDTDAKVKKLAEGFSATKTIATASPTAYIGTSAKGPQTVIFAKNDLLVFMQSSKKIDDVDWASYVTNLK